MKYSKQEILENNRMIADYIGITSKKELLGWIIVTKMGRMLTTHASTEKQAWKVFCSDDFFTESMDKLVPVMEKILDEQADDPDIRKLTYGFQYKHNTVKLSLKHGYITVSSSGNMVKDTYATIVEYLKRKKTNNEST